MFMPGIPQVWYLDLFAGRNDYEAADKGGVAGHKEINRTTLSLADVEAGLQQALVRDQIALIRLRNTSPAFTGEMEVLDAEPHQLFIRWRHPRACLALRADLRTRAFTILEGEVGNERVLMAFGEDTPDTPPAVLAHPLRNGAAT
jgi:sucrose phosphorylase